MANTATRQTKNWYIIYTAPNREKKIYNELGKRGIDAFLPMIKMVRKWSDRTKMIEVPLFLNYVFVNIPFREAWKVQTLDGVVRFVSFDGTPAIVRDDEVEYVRKMLFASDVKNELFDVKGEKVKVKYGPLAGLEGTVVDKKGVTRLYVALESMNQIISVEIEASNLAKMAG